MGIRPTEITEWTNWSAIHIQSAGYFARQAGAVESRAKADRKDMQDANVSIALHACSAGAVFLSVAFVEATINELFLGACLQTAPAGSLAQQLDDNQRVVLAAGWDSALKAGTRKTRDKSTLPKYQEALALLGAKPFDEKAPPYDHVQKLIAVRNDLIHYRPEWRTTYSVQRPETVVSLGLANRFPLSPTLPPAFLGESLHGYIGHGLAAWAVKSCFEFSEQFHARLKLKPVYDYDKTRIKTEN
jgi:hypothetical protein